jgi:hypothetical protein
MMGTIRMRRLERKRMIGINGMIPIIGMTGMLGVMVMVRSLRMQMAKPMRMTMKIRTRTRRIIPMRPRRRTIPMIGMTGMEMGIGVGTRTGGVRGRVEIGMFCMCLRSLQTIVKTRSLHYCVSSWW